MPLVLFGLMVTNLTILGRPLNPFPFVSAGAHLFAIATVIMGWRRQHPVSRVLCAFVLVPAVVLCVGNLADGVSRLLR